MTRIDFLRPFPRNTVELHLGPTSRIACAFLIMAFAFDLGAVLAERQRWDAALRVWSRSAGARAVREATRRHAREDEIARILPLYRSLANARASSAWRAFRLAQIASVLEPSINLESIEIVSHSVELRGSARDVTGVSRLLRALAHRDSLGNAVLLSAGRANDTYAPASGLEFAVRVEDAAP
jgi:hypothetical protein